MGIDWWDTVATLGYLAAITERTHLMSHVYVLPYRHPLVAAKSFLTLDELSNGRAILGVGAGTCRASSSCWGWTSTSRQGPRREPAGRAGRLRGRVPGHRHQPVPRR